MANNRELSQFANTVGYNGGNIGIGTDNPVGKLEVAGDAVISHTGANPLDLYKYGTAAPTILMYGANGTAASPTQTLTGDVIGGFNAFGYGSSGFAGGPSVRITAVATENNGQTSNRGADIKIETVTTGGTSLGERLRITAAGNLGIGNDGSFPMYTGTNDRTLILGTGSEDSAIQIHSGTSNYGGLYFGDGTSGTNRYRGYVEFKHGTGDEFLRFGTAATERLRIDSSGRLLAGTTTAGNGAADDLTLATTGNTGITVRSGTSSQGAVYFSDGTSGADEYRGIVLYDHSSNYMSFYADGSERMIISSSGVLTVGSGANTATQRAAFLGGYTAFENSAGTDNPSITFNNDTDTGILNPSGNTIAFNTGGSERMRLASSGQLYLGTSSDKTQSGCRLVVQGSGVATAEFYNHAGCYNTWSSGSTATARGFIGVANQLVTSGSGDDFAVRAQNHLTFATNGANERMRISSGGSIFINRTSAVSAEKFSVGNAGQVAYFRCTVNANHSNIQMSHSYATGGQTATQISFQNTALTEVGSIKSTVSATSFNETSDYRLKENIVDIADGITRLKQLQPRRFNYIVDPDTTVDGFIAHEAQTVVPNAVHGIKDEVDDNGNAVMQGIDRSKMVPLLTAALQEAIAKIETLETKVAALEAV